ncbi:MAG TPA: MarR family transcriptional regulator [Maritimibacter sp.]|nr:MarR family transcriptional regulator [Maritimibacter sp.]
MTSNARQGDTAIREDETINTPAAASNTTTLEPGILEDFGGHLLRLAYEAAFNDFATKLGPDSMKPAYFSILSMIRNNPGIKQVDLGRAVGRDKSSVTKALRQLEDTGLVLRERLEDDRRNYASTLTPEGEAVFDRMEAVAHHHQSELDAVIGPERMDAFLETLRDIIRLLPERTSAQ